MTEGEKICDTLVTIGQVEREFRAPGHCSEHAKITKWKASRIGVGKGFLSTVVKLELSWNEAGSKLPTSLILKIPSGQSLTDLLSYEEAGEAEKQANQEKFEEEMIPTAHKNEALTFKMLTDHKVAVPFPKFYFGPGGAEGGAQVIGMEDLSHGIMMDIMQGITLEQSKNLLAHLAHLHAWSFKNRAVWEGKTLVWSREIINQVFKDLSADKLSLLVDVDAEFFPKEKIDRAKKYLTPDTVADIWLNQLNLDLPVPTFLIHGDIHINNILFKANAEGEATEEVLAFLDWQTTREGTFMEDVVRVTVFCVVAEDRRLHEKELLKHYYESFAAHFQPDAVPFSFPQMIHAYKTLLPIHGGQMLASFPLFFGPNSPFVAGLEGEERKERLREVLLSGKYLLEDMIRIEDGEPYLN